MKQSWGGAEWIALYSAGNRLHGSRILGMGFCIFGCSALGALWKIDDEETATLLAVGALVLVGVVWATFGLGDSNRSEHDARFAVG